MAKNTKPVKATAKKKMSVGLFVALLLIYIAVPIAYPFICGLIFETWLGMYEAVPFIFWSLMTLYAASLVLIVLTTIRFVRQRI